MVVKTCEVEDERRVWEGRSGAAGTASRLPYAIDSSIQLLTLLGQYFFQFKPNGKPNTTHMSSLRTIQWKDGFVLPSFYKIVCLTFLFS